jgi:hypothetical protein
MEMSGEQLHQLLDLKEISAKPIEWAIQLKYFTTVMRCFTMGIRSEKCVIR